MTYTATLQSDFSQALCNPCIKITPATNVRGRQFLLVPYSFSLQLLHDRLELLRHGQADARSILGDGNALVGAIEENHGRPEHAAAADDLRVEEVRHADEAEDHHFLADALEAGLA